MAHQGQARKMQCHEAQSGWHGAFIVKYMGHQGSGQET